ncbi:phage baseplate assembly protein V [uncultured Algibacter sp.]|uniref:phage baseplate assembly protein V n=1 Tax=uncultured Algibacter sp. TaxID=298659 RepID=UPI003217B8D1
MAINTQIKVFLNGKLYTNVLDFSLKEKVGKHTKFSVSIRGHSLENSLDGNSILQNSKDFLGKTFTIEIAGMAGLRYEVFNFTGTITKIKGKKGREKKGLGDVINVKGYSNSILLDDGPKMGSLKDKNLSGIIEQSLTDYRNSRINVVNSPERDVVIAYSVQNNQSTFSYLQTLAASYGEYLLYHKDRLYFGKPNLGENIILKYGYDLKDFSLGLETKPLNFEYFNNDSFLESNVKSTSTSKNSQASGYTAAVTNLSNQIYPDTHLELFSTFEDKTLQRRMDDAVTLQKKLSEQKQVTLHGESVNTGVSLGKIIDIQNADGSFGSYRVIKVNHTFELRGKYKNFFKAIPIEIDVYPLTDTASVKKAEVQIAKVISTDDPDKMSRIQVQFPWQEAINETTPWIRISTPYAGGDRGVILIPEIGDQVLIGFENGEVERPFMQAALYTGVNKHDAWQSEKNTFKGIKTKAGHTIELNDTNGSEMITITDKNSNTIKIDTANNNIEISALENMTLNAKNLAINVQENMDVTVGEIHNLNAKNSNEYIDEDKTIDISQSFDQTSSEATIVASNGDMTIEGAGVSTFQGGADVKISKG